MDDSRSLLLSDVAKLAGIPLARLRTMRARGQSATWDAGSEEHAVADAGAGWRRYDMIDAISVMAVLDLMKRGVAADVASSIVGNCRQFIHSARHPRKASGSDVFIGAIMTAVGRRHVGGALPELLLKVEKLIRAELRAGASDAECASIMLCNVSRLYRRAKRRLEDAS